VEIVPGWEPGDGARHCALADSVSAALALRLAAAVMAAGAVLVVTAFEKIGFIAPDPQALDAAKASAGQDDEAA
jgi:hypothetical protein